MCLHKGDHRLIIDSEKSSGLITRIFSCQMVRMMIFHLFMGLDFIMHVMDVVYFLLLLSSFRCLCTPATSVLSGLRY